MKERGILFFTIGDRRHAVEAEAVRRIASREEEAWVRSTVLGAPANPARGLVTELEGEEATLAVDLVLGIERLSSKQVSPLPPIAEDTLGTRGISGLVSYEDELLLLVDLPNLIREAEEATPHAEVE